MSVAVMTPHLLSLHSKSKPLDEKSLLSPSRETLAEESGESQQHQQQQVQRQQQEQETQDSESDVPQRLETHEENDHQEARRITSKSARRVQSTIPNLIEDEYDDDAELGLHVEYMDEVSRTLSAKQQGGGSVSSSRAASAQSQGSAVSNSYSRCSHTSWPLITYLHFHSFLHHHLG